VTNWPVSYDGLEAELDKRAHWVRRSGWSGWSSDLPRAEHVQIDQQCRHLVRECR
jgi:hypothetical protein